MADVEEICTSCHVLGERVSYWLTTVTCTSPTNYNKLTCFTRLDFHELFYSNVTVSAAFSRKVTIKMSSISSPFPDNFNLELLTKINHDSTNATIQNEELSKTLNWLCSSPQLTSFRVNGLKGTVGETKQNLQKYVDEVLGNCSLPVEEHPTLPDVLIIKNYKVKGQLQRHKNEVIVDADCASAVLRGAHIYAPGVIGLMSGTQYFDTVSVYADLSRKCKRGFQKEFEDEKKVFIGNGIVQMRRHELFGEAVTLKGIAIKITETISGCPPLGDNFLEGQILLQNLPSIICVHNLDPQPNEIVLDMCASPGNKTTHIASLMNNKGTIIAIDKTRSKVEQLRRKCKLFSAKVLSFESDSTTKILSDKADNVFENGPPFAPETFDRILLDAPCSVLGKRPQLSNTISEKVVKSYVPLQKRLMETAVSLLKVNGVLVYSTCTITLAENEGVVSWALNKFKCLKLVPQKIHLGGVGWIGSQLTEDERKCVQRFGVDDEVDSVGFFIACFVKQ